jgi:hypothetical protein
MSGKKVKDGIKLSHTAIELYRTCPMAYKHKYVEKYSETSISSALFFGSALGSTFQMMILDKKETLTEEEKTLVGTNPYDFFDAKLRTTTFNNRSIDLPNSTEAVYFKNDYDPNVLTDEDYSVVEEYKISCDFDKSVDFKYLAEEFSRYQITNSELALYNLHHWLSLRRKGHLFIKQFLLTIYPKIKRVYEIEGAISIKNPVGDEIRGFLDLLCDYEVEAGNIQKVIVDFKTASAKYSSDKILKSQQLNLYDYDREVGGIGYIIALKNIKKPSRGENKGELVAEFQELFMPINPETQEEIIAEIDGLLHSIKSEEFPKNESQCLRMFGRRCPFYDACYSGDYSKLYKKD